MKERKGHIPFFVIKWILIAAGITVLAVAGYFAYRQFILVQVEKKHTTLSEQISQVAELTTIKDNYSDVVCVKKSAAYGMAKSYSIVKYTGIMRAGISDTTKIGFTISRDNKNVSVKLPHAVILGNELLEQEVFDEKNSIFVPITTQEIFAEIKSGMQTKEGELVQQGFLRDADAQVKKVISAMLIACGFEQVYFLY